MQANIALSILVAIQHPHAYLHATLLAQLFLMRLGCQLPRTPHGNFACRWPNAFIQRGVRIDQGALCLAKRGQYFLQRGMFVVGRAVTQPVGGIHAEVDLFGDAIRHGLLDQRSDALQLLTGTAPIQLRRIEFL
ncbi:hypothetical protein D3C81_1438040 [compost metagenome]